jgi:bacillithiol biosynthesis cysteine-adding enzyme BshC
MTLLHEWIDLAQLPGAPSLFRGLMERDPAVARRFPGRYWEPRDLDGVLRPGSGSRPLWGRIAEELRRLGAPESSLRLLEETRDRGVVVVTGQQPGLLGGPLYTLHKIATAVDLARWIRKTRGIPCLAVLWNAADDTDFDEISEASIPGTDLCPVTFTIDRSSHEAGRWVGDIPLAALEPLGPPVAGLLDALAVPSPVREMIGRARTGSRDLGDFFSALCLRFFAGAGLAVVDARWPEVRTGASGLFETYVEVADEVHAEVSAAGDALEKNGHRRGLSERAARFGVLVVEDGRRLEVAPAARKEEVRARLRSRPETLAPNVLLRPLVQDSLLPSAAVVLGPGETSYWAQLPGVYERLGVPMPVVWPRMTATWVPAEAEGALGAGGPGEALRALDSLLHARRREALPDDLGRALENLRQTVGRGVEDLRRPLEAVDRGLLEVLDSAARKMDFQVRTIEERAMAKGRARSEEATLLSRVREILRPEGAWQERVYASLWPFLVRGPSLEGEVLALAALHRERLLTERGAHLAIRLERGA